MKVASVSVLLALLVFMFGCPKVAVPDADTKQAKSTAQMMSEAERQIGMPNIVNWQERKLMKSILELRDREDLICYAYIVTITGEKIFLGKCLGFGLPYSVQFTNPERIAHQHRHSGGSFGTMPQPDPNGLFMPEGLSATWLMLIDPKTDEARPVYIEPEILVSPFPMH